LADVDLVVDRTRKWLSIAGVALLGFLIAVAQLIIPGKKTSLAEFAEVYRPEVARAQVPEEAYAAETKVINNSDTRQDARPALAHETADHDEVLRTLDDAEDQLIELASNRGPTAIRGSDNQVRELTEAKRSLETQQEGLIQEINRLRKQIQLKANSDTQNQADSIATAEQMRQLNREKQALSQEVLNLREKSATDRANLSLLADHILKLRAALKVSDENTKRLNDELAEAQGDARGLDNLNGEVSRLNDTLEDAKSQREKIVDQLDASQKRNKDFENAVADLRKKIDSIGAEKLELQRQVASVRDELRVSNEDLESAKRQLSKTIADAKSCGTTLQAKGELASQVPSLSNRVKELEVAVHEKEKQNETLETQLKDKEELVSNIPSLKKELLASKNQLLLKEREMSILGNNTGRPEPTPRIDQAARDRALERTGREAGEETLRGKNVDLGSDVMVVEVLGSRVALRSGPSPDDSEVMPVGKGTRLTVEERSGDWYRVITPNSNRAYIRSDMVRVISGGENSSSEPPIRRMRVLPQKRALKAMPDDGSMEPFGDVGVSPMGDKEERAFQQLRKGVGNTGNRAPEMIP